jgi:hypothetical protein
MAVERSIIIPPVKDVIKDIFKPLIRICGEILLISGTALNAELIPIYVAKRPNKALKIPNNTIPLVL